MLILAHLRMMSFMGDERIPENTSESITEDDEKVG